MKPKPCAYCGGENHTSLTCYSKRKAENKIIKARRILRSVSKSSMYKKTYTTNAFFVTYPPDERYGYTCYLGISSLCPGWLPADQITQEHVFPKGTWPEVKYNLLNLKPACPFCNKVKGGLTVYKLAAHWPHLVVMIQSPEWRAWEEEIRPFLKRPLPELLPVL